MRIRSISGRGRALAAWLLGGVLAGFAVMPICDLHFDCGCGWPGFGGYSHCDIHTPGPPDCPWCDQLGTLVLSMLFSYGIGLASVLWIPRRTPIAIAVLVSLVAVLAGTVLTGIVTSLLLGQPVFSGL